MITLFRTTISLLVFCFVLGMTFLGAMSTASAQVTFNSSGTQAVDVVAPAGNAAVTLTAPSLNIIIDANLTGGNGTDGANGGPNNGTGAWGAVITNPASQHNQTITLTSGHTARGGNGGNGGNGAASAGGNGGVGSVGISLNSSNNQVHVVDGNYIGGNGGSGGSGNGGNNLGGQGGDGGVGLFVLGGNATSITVRGAITGGDGGNSGNSAGTGARVATGSGGHGLRITGGALSSGTVTIESTAVVAGGTQGTPGAGTGGIPSGIGGSGIVMNRPLTLLDIHSGAVVRSGATGNTNYSNGNAGIEVLNSITTLNNGGNVYGGSLMGSGMEIGGGGTVITNLTNTATGTFGDLARPGRGYYHQSGTVTNLVNQGQILSNGTAFEANGGTIITNLNNSGTIRSNSGRAMNLNGTVGSFSNSGTIRADNSDTILLNTTAVLPNVINNTGGLITSAFTNLTSGTIRYNLDMAGKSIVGGTIENTALNGYAIHSGTNQTGSFTLQDVTINGSVGGSGNNQFYTFAGNTSLTGNVHLGSGANGLHLNGTFTGGATTDFTASGGTIALSVGSSGNVILNGAQELANNISSLTVNNSGKLTLNENFASAGALTNDGTITLGTNDTLSVGSMNAGGVGNSWIFSVADATTNGKLLVGGGNAVDFTNSQIGVDLSAVTGSLPRGTLLMIADGGSAANMGDLDGKLLQQSGLLSRLKLYRGDNPFVTAAGADATKVYLLVDRNTWEGIAQSSDTKLIGRILDLSLASSSNPLASIDGTLSTASSDAAVERSLKELQAPDQIPVASNNFAILNDINKTIGNRIGDVSGPIGASAAADTFPTMVWLEAFGKIADLDLDHSSTNYESNSYGWTAGIDNDEFLSNALLGAAFSFGTSEITSDASTRNKTKSQLAQATVYGQYRLTPHAFLPISYVEAQASFGLSRNDSERFALGQQIKGDYVGYNWGLRTEMGRGFTTPWQDMTVTPYVVGNYQYYGWDSYAERGLGALQVDDGHYDRLEVGLGAKTHWTFYRPSGAKIQPSLKLEYRRDLLSNDTQAQASFVGAQSLGSFDTKSPAQNNDMFTLGTGVKLFSATNWQMSANYGLDAAKGYTAHSATVRAGIRF